MQLIDPNKALDALLAGVPTEDICKVLNTIAKTEERLSEVDVNDVTRNSEQSSLGRHQSDL